MVWKWSLRIWLLPATGGLVNDLLDFPKSTSEKLGQKWVKSFSQQDKLVNSGKYVWLCYILSMTNLRSELGG